MVNLQKHSARRPFHSKRIFIMYISEKFSEFFPVTDGKFEVRYPSVTRVLGDTSDKSFLIAWKERIGEEEANRISKESAEFGDALHMCIENYLLGVPQEIPKSRVGMTFKNILTKLKPKNIEVVGIEVPMQSKTLGVQGRCDFIAFIDGELCILDWKSKKNLPVRRDWINDYFLQCTAYALCFKEHTGELPKKLHVVLGNEMSSQWVTEDLTRSIVSDLRSRVNQYTLSKQEQVVV